MLCTERAFLGRLDGSCRTPIAGLAVLEAGAVHFRGLILTPDGREAHATERRGAPQEAVKLAVDALQDRSREVRYRACLLLALSQEDLTAAEFVSATSGDARWRSLLDSGKVRQSTIPAADHTLSSTPHMKSFETMCVDFLNTLEPIAEEAT